MGGLIGHASIATTRVCAHIMEPGLSAILAMLEFIGFGKPNFVKADVKPDGGHHVIFHVKDNPVIEHASRLFGAKSLVCNWFMGVYAAHGELELGLKHVKVHENKCVCKGARYCEWETRW